MIVEDRFSRNVALFGCAGQKRISASVVGVVGLGGLGSHVAQQLVYLGVRDLTYVDDDQITTSSLNRVLTAVEDDAFSTAKVDAAARLTHAVAVDARVVALHASLEDAPAQEALARCTSVFGCLDSGPARIGLIELCARHRIPFFDLATDTGADEGIAYGGRVLFSGDASAALPAWICSTSGRCRSQLWTTRNGKPTTASMECSGTRSTALARRSSDSTVSSPHWP